MADPKPTFTYLVQELKKLNIAFLHLVSPRISGNTEKEVVTDSIDYLVDIWDNQSPVLIAGGFTAESAKKAVDEEFKDKNVVIVFGRYFITNPDLPFRVKEGIDFRPYEREKFYLPKDPNGYINYDFSKQFLEVSATGKVQA